MVDNTPFRDIELVVFGAKQGCLEFSFKADLDRIPAVAQLVVMMFTLYIFT